MAQLPAPPPATPAKPLVEEPLWRPLDDGGWMLLAKREFHDAYEYFCAAYGHLSSLPANDYRQGRTQAGLAWTMYRLTQQVTDGDATDEEVEARYEKALTHAAAAVNLLREAQARGDLPAREVIYLAKAEHIWGTVLIELCRGEEASTALQAAARSYDRVRARVPRHEVLHLLGKLLQCRRRFEEAATVFRQIVAEAQDPETSLRALIDLANTLLWLGAIRLAWSLQADWRRIDAQLRALPACEVPNTLLLRGQLLFARINVWYGDFAEARRLLNTIQDETCIRCSSHSICAVVYGIVSAELALEQGALLCAAEYLNRASDTAVGATHVDRGYSCLDLVAIDAGCRRCVIECCSHECFIACGPCRPSRRIVFTTETVSMQPIKHQEILFALISSLTGRLWLNAGQMNQAAHHLNTARMQIEALINPYSPLLFPILVAQVQLAQERYRPLGDVMVLLQQLLSFSLLMHVSPPPPPAPLPPPPPSTPTAFVLAWHRELLGETRNTTGFYEAAQTLFSEAIGQGQQFRASRHPQHEYLRLRVGWTQGIAQTGQRSAHQQLAAAHSTLQQSLDIIRDKLRSLHDALVCDDYRLLVSQNLLTWLWMLTCPRAEAIGPFLQLENRWYERDLRFGWSPEPVPVPTAKGTPNPPKPVRDPRQALAMLGTIALQLEFPEFLPPAAPAAPLAGKPLVMPDPLERYVALLRSHHAGTQEIACELEQLAELLDAVGMEDAAAGFREKAKTLLPIKPVTAPAKAPDIQQPTMIPVPAHGGGLFRRWRRR